MNAKHHIYQHGAPLCGTKSKAPIAATVASPVHMVCAHCIRIAGPFTTEIVRESTPAIVNGNRTDRPEYPRALAVAGHYMLWRTGAALYVINDERCPRAHAHTVWSGTDADAAWGALRQLADSDVALTPCVRA